MNTNNERETLANAAAFFSSAVQVFGSAAGCGFPSAPWQPLQGNAPGDEVLLN